MYTGGKWVLAAIDALGGGSRIGRVPRRYARHSRRLPRGLVTLDEYGSPIRA